MASKSLRAIQYGVETTSGTEASATTIWRGVGGFDDQLTYNDLGSQEDVGLYVPTDRSNISKTLGQMDFDDTFATYEQLPIILSAGVENIIAGVADGAGSDYTYQYDFPVTTASTIKTYTMEMEYSALQEYQMLYSFVRNFSLKGVPGEKLMVSSTWNGRQIATGTKTASLSIPAVEEIDFSKGKLYIDAATGTIGTTVVSNAFYGMDFSVDTGWMPLFTADGEIYFSNHVFNRDNLNANLGITFQFAAGAMAQLVNWRAETAQQIKVIFEGSAFTTAGTTYSNHTLILNCAGKWDRFDKIGEADGNDIIDGNFKVSYNSSADVSFAQLIVVNELATLT